MSGAWGGKVRVEPPAGYVFLPEDTSRPGISKVRNFRKTNRTTRNKLATYLNGKILKPKSRPRRDRKLCWVAD
jgi:hypothetical protein